MKVLVTGASGFVGKNLVKSLFSKYEFYGYSRKTLEQIKYFQGDITDSIKLGNALENIDTVVHLAGVIRGSKKEFYHTNVLGAQNLSNQALKHNVKKIIYISSLAAQGPKDKNEPVSYYGYTKRFAEIELQKNSNHYRLIIIRPPVIYGPYESEVFKIIKFAYQSGIFFVLKDRLINFVYIGDLIKAVDLVLEDDKIFNGVYTICESKAYNFLEIANIIAYHLNKKLKIITINDFYLYFADKLIRKSGIFYDKIREIRSHYWVCNTNAFSRNFNFKSENDLFNGIYKTIRWYRENGWL